MKKSIKTVALTDMKLHQRVKIYCATHKITLIDLVQAALTQYIRNGEGASK